MIVLAVAGGGLTLLFLFMGGVYFFRGELQDKVLENMEIRLIAAEPDGFGKEKIHDILAKYRMAFDSNWINEEAANKLQIVLPRLFAVDTISSEDARGLLLTLDDITSSMGPESFRKSASQYNDSDSLDEDSDDSESEW